MFNKRKIKDNIFFKYKRLEDQFSIYCVGKIIYPDGEEYDFGKAIMFSSICRIRKGSFVYNDKYIFSFLMDGSLPRIFDIDNRCEINDLSLVRKIYENYFEIKEEISFNLLKRKIKK